jgi:hypothetical protein
VAKYSDELLIKDARFGKIILNIAQCYLDNVRKKNHALSSEDINEFYSNALVYFIRLIFLKMAPSRRRFSGKIHFEEIISKSMRLLNELSDNKSSNILWSDIKELSDFVSNDTEHVIFSIRNSSAPAEDIQIADNYLAPALFYLKNIETDLDIKLRDMNEFFIGSLYDYWSNQSVKLVHDSLWFDKDKKQSDRVFFYHTPEYMIDYVVHNTVGKKLESIKKEIRKNRISGEQDIIDYLKELKILDPAMGSGHFLVKAANFITDEIINLPKKYFSGELLRTVRSDWVKSLVFQRCIYGADSDPFAVELTKYTFLLADYGEDDTIARYEKAFKCGNALIDNVLICDNALQWQREFPEVFKNGQGFDCIIGIPPNGNFLKRGEKSYIQYNYPPPKDKISDNAGEVFINRSRQLLIDNGFLSFVVPKALVYSPAWSDSRLLLVKELRLIEIADNGQCFPGLPKEMVTFLAQKKSDKRDRNIRVIELYSSKRKKINPEKTALELPLKYFSKESFIISAANRRELELFEKLESVSVPLEKLARVFIGLPLNNRLQSSPDMENPVKIIRGKHIDRGHIRGFDYLDAEDLPEDPLIGDIVMREIVSLLYEPQPRIRLVGALNPERILTVNTVTNIKLRAAVSIPAAYILAMLHTELLNLYIYRLIYSNSLRTMHFSSKNAKKVPIPILPDEHIEEIVRLFEQFCRKYPDNRFFETEIDRILIEFLADKVG